MHSKLIETTKIHCLQTKQDGSALIVSMLILLVMTVIGISALNTSMLQEKMASNTQKKTLAFHDAEAAIQHAIQTASKPTDTAIGKAMDAYQVDGKSDPTITPPVDSAIEGYTKVSYTGQQIPVGYSMDKFTSLQLKFTGKGKVASSEITNTNVQGAVRNAPKM